MNSSRPLIAITGGIGSGKSVVSKILRVLGYTVYDCDSRARFLMDGDPVIKRRIAAEVSAEAIVGDSIDRQRLAAAVFADEALLERLNTIVHGAVRDDLKAYCAAASVGDSRSPIFVETAILYQSGLDRMVDTVWEVTAPRDLRIERVITRSGLTAAQVEARITSQESYRPQSLHPRVNLIVNDGFTPLLPQLESLLSTL